MPSTKLDSKAKLQKLIEEVKLDFPNIQFCESNEFRWSPEHETIFYDKYTKHNCDQRAQLLLHELAHATLKHNFYFYDVELLGMELAAWRHTQEILCPRYRIKFDTKLADEFLETYRNWIFERSLCPKCHNTGQQNKNLCYGCLSCGTSWKANLAKQTHLKRTKIK